MDDIVESLRERVADLTELNMELEESLTALQRDFETIRDSISPVIWSILMEEEDEV